MATASSLKMPTKVPGITPTSTASRRARRTSAGAGGAVLPWSAITTRGSRGAGVGLGTAGPELTAAVEGDALAGGDDDDAPPPPPPPHDVSTRSPSAANTSRAFMISTMERGTPEPVTQPEAHHEIVTEVGGIRLRRMRDSTDDYELLARWLNESHVREWWDPDDPPATADTVRSDYGAYTEPEDPTTACIVELDGRTVGYLQFYPWSADEEYARTVGLELMDGEWGLDILIGEPDLIGIGIGSRVVDVLCSYLTRERGAPSIALVTETTNTRAHRAYERVGFRRVGEILDTDTRDGERVRSYVMRRP